LKTLRRKILFKKLDGILFDIDLTIFDRNRFAKDINEKLSKILKTSFENINLEEKNYVSSLKSSSDFNSNTFLKILSKKFDKEFLFLKKVRDDIFNKSYIYEDFLKLKKFKNFGIFSEGFKYFQLDKLKKTGIYRFFDKSKIFIFRRKLDLKNLDKISGNYIVIDDRINVCEALQKTKNLFPILIDRAEDKNFSGTKIKSLLELEEIF